MFFNLDPEMQVIGGSTKDASPLWGRFCFIFLYFGRKIGQNNRLASPLLQLAPLLWKILNPSLQVDLTLFTVEAILLFTIHITPFSIRGSYYAVLCGSAVGFPLEPVTPGDDVAVHPSEHTFYCFINQSQPNTLTTRRKQ